MRTRQKRLKDDLESGTVNAKIHWLRTDQDSRQQAINDLASHPVSYSRSAAGSLGSRRAVQPQLTLEN